MTQIRPGSLKCVVAAVPDELSAIVPILVENAGEADVRVLGVSAVLVHTEEETAGVRDWLRGAGGVLVVEFEKWSGIGTEVPREWLLARGH
jgi:hypothetical protein